MQKIRITAADLSLNMIKVAERHVVEAGLADRISVGHVDSRNLPYSNQSIDGIISNSVIHHLLHPVRALREIGRVIRPDGLIMIRDLIRPETPELAQRLVEQYDGNDTTSQRKLFYDSLLSAFTIPEIEDLIAQSNLPGAIVIQSSDRHWSIERPSRGS